MVSENTPPDTPKPGVLEGQLRGVLRKLHYSYETEKSYVGWYRRQGFEVLSGCKVMDGVWRVKTCIASRRCVGSAHLVTHGCGEVLGSRVMVLRGRPRALLA